MRDLIAQDKKLVENFLELGGVLQAALGDGLPGRFAARTVGLLLNAAHAGQRLFLAVELDGHRAADFLVLLGEPGDLRFARDVFLAVDFHLRLHAAAINIVERGKLRKERRLHELLHEGELARLEPRIDHLDDVHIGLLLGLVVGLAGHGDVGQRGGLGQGGADFAVMEQPRLKIGDGRGGFELCGKLVEDRRELRRIGQVDGFGKELPRCEVRRLHGG